MVMMVMRFRILPRSADRHNQCGIRGRVAAYFGVGKRGFVYQPDFPQPFNQRQDVHFTLFVGFAGKGLRLAVVVRGRRVFCRNGIGGGGYRRACQRFAFV